MDNIILNTIKHSAGVIDNVIVLYFITQFFHYRDDIKHKYIYSAALIILSSSILLLCKNYPELNGFFTIIVVVLYYLYSIWFLNGSKLLKLIVCLNTFVLYSVFSALFYFLMSIFTNNIDGQKHDLYMAIIFLMRTFAILVFSEIFLVLFNRKNMIFRKNERFILLLIFISFSIMSIYVPYIIMNNNISISFLSLVICSIIMTIVTYVLLYDVTKNNEKLRKASLLKVVNQNLKIQIDQLAAQQLELRKLKHDFDNHLTGLNKLAFDSGNKAIQEYIHALNSSLTIDSSCVKICENMYLNAVLSAKKKICDEKKIDLTFTIMCDTTLINGYQGSVILFNLIDNAIEACEHFPDDMKRIALVLRDDHRYINITLSNPIEHSVLSTNKYLTTTKANKTEHGLGHLIVSDTVKENDGILEYYEKDNEFIAHALLKKCSETCPV